MLWTPLIIALQISFVYLLLNKPHLFEKRNAPTSSASARLAGWGLAQTLPLAVFLSFPTLILLLFVDNWLWPIGLLEVAAVHGVYWWFLVRWWKRLAWRWSGGAVADASTIAGPPEIPGLPVDSPTNAAAGVIAPRLPALAPPPIPLDTIYQSVGGELQSLLRTEPATPVGAASGKQLRLDRLVKTYMWDPTGAGEPFRTSRTLPVDRLITPEDLSRAGFEFVNAMRRIARATITEHERDGGLFEHGGQAADSEDGIDDYVVDVMQRLTQSVLFERQHLFIDGNDVDVLGWEAIDRMYRMALFEVRTAAA